jgi:hypothetical protein
MRPYRPSSVTYSPVHPNGTHLLQIKIQPHSSLRSRNLLPQFLFQSLDIPLQPLVLRLEVGEICLLTQLQILLEGREVDLSQREHQHALSVGEVARRAHLLRVVMLSTTESVLDSLCSVGWYSPCPALRA